MSNQVSYKVLNSNVKVLEVSAFVTALAIFVRSFVIAKRLQVKTLVLCYFLFFICFLIGFCIGLEWGIGGKQ